MAPKPCLYMSSKKNYKRKSGLYSFIISSLLTLIHYFSIKYKGYDINEKPIVLSETSNEIIEKIESLNVKNWVLKSKTEKSIIFTTKADYINSYGEIIEINFLDKKTVLIKSKPKFITTIFDFGKNLDNVHEMARLLS